MTVLAIDISILELTGLSGAAIYVLGYVSAAYDRIPSQSIHFYTLRLAAACLVMIGLVDAFNLAAAVIQIFFIAVSLVGVMRHLGREKAQKLGKRPPSTPVFRTCHASTADRN